MELESQYRNKELDSELKGARNDLDAANDERSWFAKGFTYALFILILAVGVVIFLLIRYKRKKELAENLSDKQARSEDEISTLTTTLGDKNDVLHVYFFSGTE